MVFQSYAIWPHMIVFENVAFPLVCGGCRIPKAEVKHRVLKALHLVQMNGFERAPCAFTEWRPAAARSTRAGSEAVFQQLNGERHSDLFSILNLKKRRSQNLLTPYFIHKGEPEISVEFLTVSVVEAPNQLSCSRTVLVVKQGYL
jgi:hypothetical protein